MINSNFGNSAIVVFIAKLSPAKQEIVTDLRDPY